MNLLRHHNKCIRCLYNQKCNRNLIKSNKYTKHRLRIVCNVNEDDNNQKYNNISSEKRISNSSKYIDNGLFLFTTIVFSSVMVLSTCIVMILCARETNMEASRLQEKYNKLYEEVKHLEDKNKDDEMMINAIVGEIIELKSFGII